MKEVKRNEARLRGPLSFGTEPVSGLVGLVTR
jgi:hypothetical protein